MSECHTGGGNEWVLACSAFCMRSRAAVASPPRMCSTAALFSSLAGSGSSLLTASSSALSSSCRCV